MKKIISVLAVTAFTLTFAQEAPKKSCCAGKDKKECSMSDKKMAKTCDMKDHKDCKMNKKDCKMDQSTDRKAAKKA